MLGSKSKFFYQSKYKLKAKKEQLIRVLIDFDIKDIYKFIEAFDYFCKNPEKFDGATIVKDLETIKGLDASAMVHDWEYLTQIEWNSLRGLKQKLKADFQFGKHQELTGKGIFAPYTRTFLLWLSTPFYYLIYKII